MSGEVTPPTCARRQANGSEQCWTGNWIRDVQKVQRQHQRRALAALLCLVSEVSHYSRVSDIEVEFQTVGVEDDCDSMHIPDCLI